MMNVKHYALAAIFLAAPAQAQWTPAAYTAETDECLPACVKNPPNSQDKCVAYCHCFFDEAQTQFPDHDAIKREILQEKRADRIATFQMIANSCNQKVFGVPARKLKTD